MAIGEQKQVGVTNSIENMEHGFDIEKWDCEASPRTTQLGKPNLTRQNQLNVTRYCIL